MKNYLLILSVLLLSGIGAVQSVLAQETLNFAAVDNQVPYTWKENQKAKGIDVDMVQELCRRIQVKCNINFVPWKRAMLNTETGSTDGALSAMRKPEREAFAHYLEYPIHYSTYNIFVKKGHEFPFKTIKDLYGKKMGKNRGWNTGEEFDKAVAEGKIRLEEAEDVTANLTKLNLGRIEGYVGQTTQTRAKIKELSLSDRIVYLPHLFFNPSPVYLIISKAAKIANKKRLIQKMNRALKEMYEDGTVEKINSKYLE